MVVLSASAPRPLVDYLIARAGPPPASGLAYDYVLGGDGLYVAARSEALSVRVPVARCTVRGLPPLYAACTLRHGRLPLDLWHAMTEAAREGFAGGHEVFLAVTHDGCGGPAGYRLTQPAQVAGPDRVVYERQPNTVLEFHSHGAAAARFSATDDRDEQRLAVYAVVGGLGRGACVRAEVALRIGAYGYFLPVPWESVFAGGPEDRRGFRDTSFEAPDDPEDLPDGELWVPPGVSAPDGPSRRVSPTLRGPRAPVEVISRLVAGYIAAHDAHQAGPVDVQDTERDGRGLSG